MSNVSMGATSARAEIPRVMGDRPAQPQTLMTVDGGGCELAVFHIESWRGQGSERAERTGVSGDLGLVAA